MKVLAINGLYRNDGITEQMVEAMVQAIKAVGAEIEVIFLSEHPIELKMVT